MTTTQPTTQAEPLQMLVDCCTPIAGRVLDESQAQALAAVLKAIAEPTRLRLLSLVAAREGAEACVCELTDPVGLSQPTVSHHLKILVDAGLLEREQRGRWAYYRLIPDALQTLAQLMAATTRDARHGQRGRRAPSRTRRASRSPGSSSPPRS